MRQVHPQLGERGDATKHVCFFHHIFTSACRNDHSVLPLETVRRGAIVHVMIRMKLQVPDLTLLRAAIELSPVTRRANPSPQIALTHGRARTLPAGRAIVCGNLMARRQASTAAHNAPIWIALRASPATSHAVSGAVPHRGPKSGKVRTSRDCRHSCIPFVPVRPVSHLLGWAPARTPASQRRSVADFGSCLYNCAMPPPRRHERRGHLTETDISAARFPRGACFPRSPRGACFPRGGSIHPPAALSPPATLTNGDGRSLSSRRGRRSLTALSSASRRGLGAAWLRYVPLPLPC